MSPYAELFRDIEKMKNHSDELENEITKYYLERIHRNKFPIKYVAEENFCQKILNLDSIDEQKNLQLDTVITEKEVHLDPVKANKNFDVDTAAEEKGIHLDPVVNPNLDKVDAEEGLKQDAAEDSLDLEHKAEFAKEEGKLLKQIEIEENSTGYSFETMFGEFLDSNVTSVLIRDPFIRAHHQVLNFVRFCELLLKKCQNLTYIKLVTKPDKNQHLREIQESKFQELQERFSKRQIDLSWKFENFHDRQILFNNGLELSIGRGLDIYKPPDSDSDLDPGYFDLDLRKCLGGTVNILFHTPV